MRLWVAHAVFRLYLKLHEGTHCEECELLREILDGE